jgi:hypothetical protein
LNAGPSDEFIVRSLSDERVEKILGLPSVAYVSTSSFASKQGGSIFGPCTIPLNFAFGVLEFFDVAVSS